MEHVLLQQVPGLSQGEITDDLKNIADVGSGGLSALTVALAKSAEISQESGFRREVIEAKRLEVVAPVYREAENALLAAVAAHFDKLTEQETGIDAAFRRPRLKGTPEAQVRFEAFARDVQTHFKTLSGKERRSAALEAIEAGNFELIEALMVGYPPILSGPTLDEVREAFSARKFPAALRERERLQTLAARALALGRKIIGAAALAGHRGLNAGLPVDGRPIAIPTFAENLAAWSRFGSLTGPRAAEASAHGASLRRNLAARTVADEPGQGDLHRRGDAEGRLTAHRTFGTPRS